MNPAPPTRSRFFKLSAVLWSLGLGICFIVCAGAVMLPSTKRANPRLIEELERQQRQWEREDAAARAAEAQHLANNPNPVWRLANDLFGSSSTRPSTQPTTRTLLLPGTKFGVLSPPSTQYQFPPVPPRQPTPP